MSSIEAAPGILENQEKEPSLEERLDVLEHDAGRHDLSLVATGFAAEKTVLETFPQEKQLAAATEIRERTKDAAGKLRRLKLAAALATTLLAMNPEDTVAKNQEPVTAEALAENPGRLEELLEGVLISIQEEQAKADRPELAPLQEETSSVLRRLQDENQGGRYGTLAIRIGEIGMRALATAGGLGLGVACYDAIKEVVKTVRKT